MLYQSHNVPPGVLGLTWEALAALGTVAAVGVAAYQIRLARRESRLRTTFEHLRELESRLVAMGKVNPKLAQKEVLAAFRKEVAGLSDSAQAYISLLYSLEFLALAIQTGTVDRSLGKQQLKAACREHVVSVAYLKDFQTTSGDAAAYGQLAKVLHSVARSSRIKAITIKAQALFVRFQRRPTV